MVKSVEELKALIEWAKETRVKKLKMGDIEVELADLAFIEQLGEFTENVPAKDLSATKTSSIDEESNDKEDEEAILFHSSR